MSEKLRRQKDIIKNSTKSYLDAINDYQDYYDGASPIEITYYQIADEASRTDSSLEDTHEVVGSNSSLKYYRIKHLPARGMSALDISTQLTQRGLESFINGEFVLSPSAGIFPRSGEFFTFEDQVSPELNQHLFVITDVQYDKATNKKFFKCTYKLYPLNSDTIINDNTIVGKYVYSQNGQGNNNGVGDSRLITEEENDLNDAINNLADSLVDKFEELFYDEGLDTFIYQKPLDQSGTNFSYYWSPYICHFIYNTNILEKSHREFLTEIFVQDINEREFPNIYSEEGYRKSIFYAIEVGDSEGLRGIKSSFAEISAYDLSKPLNLPFFTSGEHFYLVDVDHSYNQDFWLGAFNWIYDNENILYKDIDGLYRYTGDLIPYLVDGGYIDADGNVNLETIDKIVGQTFYQLPIKNGSIFNIKSMTRIPKGQNLVPYLCDLYSIITENGYLGDLNLLMRIIRSYLSSPNSFAVTEKMLNDLNKYYYRNSFNNYMLLPIIIYILRNSKGEVENVKK